MCVLVMFVVNCLVVVFVGIAVVVVVVVVLAMIFPKEFIIMDAFPLPVEGTETRVNAGAGANEFMVTFTETCERIGTFCPCQCVLEHVEIPQLVGHNIWIGNSPTPSHYISSTFVNRHTVKAGQLMSPQKPQIHRISDLKYVAIIVGTWIFNWIYRTELMIPGCGSYCAF